MPLGGISIKNRESFEREIANFGNHTMPEKLQKVVRVASATALRSVVSKTPVGNPAAWAASSLPPPPGYQPGRARGGWVVTIGKPSEQEITRIDPSGAATIAAGLATISAAGPYDTVFIANNTPYIIELEMGWSKQAPHGMIRTTTAQLRTLRFS